MSADPKGAGHGWAAFSGRARRASRKIPERMTGRVRSVGEAVFFGSVSLTRVFDARPFGAGFAVRAARVGPAKGMNPLAARRVEACDFGFRLGQRSEEQDQRLSSAGAAEFISFGRRQRKRNQRKTSPRSQRHDELFVPGFFDSPSMARSKNAAHPCAAPSGSAICSDHLLRSRSRSRSGSGSRSRSGRRWAVECCASRMTWGAAGEGPNNSVPDRHSRESGNPASLAFKGLSCWMPASAGATTAVHACPGEQ